MKYLSFLLISIFIFSCAKKEQTVECLSSTTHKLKSIEYDVVARQWIENFFYDSADRLIRIEDLSFEGQAFDLVYSDGRLLKINLSNLETNILERVDSFGYNQMRNVVSILTHFTDLDRGDLQHILEYEDGRISRLYSEIRDVRFTWSGDNISKREYFDQTGKIQFEIVYEHDNKINFEKGLYKGKYSSSGSAGSLLAKSEYWNENNITKVDRIDYVEIQYDNGTTDDGCPCPIEYEYNDDCYPISSLNGARTKKIIYE